MQDIKLYLRNVSNFSGEKTIKRKIKKISYAVPEISICTLKFVMSTMLDEEVNVITAVVDCPGVSLVLSLSQLIVIGPFAVVGVQVLVEMLNVNDVPVPVFLT